MAISAAGREEEMKLQGKWKEEMRPYGTKRWCLDYCSIKTQGTNCRKWSFTSSAALAITRSWLVDLDFSFVCFFFLFCLFVGFYLALFLEKTKYNQKKNKYNQMGVFNWPSASTEGNSRVSILQEKKSKLFYFCTADKESFVWELIATRTWTIALDQRKHKILLWHMFH